MVRLIPFAFVLIALAACQPVDANEDTTRTVSVSGKGAVAATPDMAYVSLSIQIRKTRLDSAQQEVANIVQRFLGLTTSLGIDSKQVQSSGAIVRPEYEWDKVTRTQKLIGYSSERQLQVELRDLDKLGKLIEGAVNAGINQVSPPVLDSSKRRELYREALALAAEDAKDNADILVTTLDGTLGDAITISAGGGYQPRPPQQMMRAEMAMSDGAAEATYNTGDINFEANVSVTFEIK